MNTYGEFKIQYQRMKQFVKEDERIRVQSFGLDVVAVQYMADSATVLVQGFDENDSEIIAMCHLSQFMVFMSIVQKAQQKREIGFNAEKQIVGVG